MYKLQRLVRGASEEGLMIDQTKSFRDSGQRSSFSTGAVRDIAQGKGRMDLVPPFSIMFLSRIYEVGCLKYGDRNWEKGIPISRYVDSALRHLQKYQSGMRDEPHLSMALWNISCALWTGAMVTIGLRPIELFDLPNHVSEGLVKPLSEHEEKSLNTFLGKQ